MKYAVEVGSCAIIYMPNFIEIGSGIQKLIVETHRHYGDRISLLLFFRNMENRLMKYYPGRPRNCGLSFWRVQGIFQTSSGTHPASYLMTRALSLGVKRLGPAEVLEYPKQKLLCPICHHGLELKHLIKQSEKRNFTLSYGLKVLIPTLHTLDTKTTPKIRAAQV
jgi:hypothetical protein